MINYNNRKFKAMTNSENGEVEKGMVFHYIQVDNLLSCNYRGANIKEGNLLGLVLADGSLDFRYHQ